MADDEKSTEIRFGWKKTLAYSLLPLVFLLGFIEGAARVVEIWRPPWKADYGWGFNPDSRLFVPSESEPGIMVTSPAKEANFHRQRFPMPKPPDTFRIFMLGGSSVNYLDFELKQLHLRLLFEFGNRLKFGLINAGGLTYGSHRLVAIASEILEYEPDLVLIYSGHNEFEELEQLELARLGTLPLQKVLYKSAFCRFVRDRIASYQVSKLEREKNRQILSNPDPNLIIGLAWQHDFTPEEVAERMDVFRNNLAIMVSLCQAKGVPVIIGTVPSNLVKPELRAEDAERYQAVLELFEKGEYEKGAALGREILNTSIRHQSSDQENQVIRSVAEEFGIPLADVEAAIIEAEPHHVPGETLFTDICHLNVRGRQILMETYEAEVLRILKDRLGMDDP